MKEAYQAPTLWGSISLLAGVVEDNEVASIARIDEISKYCKTNINTEITREVSKKLNEELALVSFQMIMLS